DGLSDNYGFAAVQDGEGRMWMSTRNGLHCLEGGSIRRFGPREGLPPQSGGSLVADEQTGIWLAPQVGGLLQFRDGRVRRAYSAKDGLKDQVRGMSTDFHGGLWLGYHSGGLAHFADGKITNYGAESGLPANGIYSLLAERT